MNRKISVLIIVTLLCMSSVIIFDDDVDVDATPGGGGGEDNGDIGLNFSYIKEITYLLSNVIKDAYEEGDLRKGRAFGTDGEIYAAENIIEYEMNKIGLWNVTKEQMENRDGKTSGDLCI